MILRNRLFTRKPPSRNAKSIYIFCEGVKRESQYFQYFKELDSRINIEIYELNSTEDNSPSGLFRIASKCLVKSDENQNPKYELLENDEVWIVLDTDRDNANSRQPQIQDLRRKCSNYNWNVSQSNPCFEVWLFNHFFKVLPKLGDMNSCRQWKQKLHEESNGGFDSRKHPILINDAIENSKNSFKLKDKIPDIGCTEVYLLAESIYELTKEQIIEIRNSIS